MADDPEKAPEQVELDIRLLAILQRHKTIRVGIISAAVCVCVIAISWAVVKVMDQPPWAAVTTAVISVVPPSLIFYAHLKALVRYNRRARAGRLIGRQEVKL